SAGGPGGRPRRLPRAARADRAGACGGAGHRGRVQELGALRGRAAGAGDSDLGLRDGATGLRLSVHLLHRSDDAGAGAEPQVGGRGARGDGPRLGRHHRGDAPWPNGQQLRRRHARLCPPAARGWAYRSRAAVAGERLERLVAAGRDIARRTNVALVGSAHEVLVEGRAKRGDLLQGRTRTNKIALFPGPDAWIGGYRDVRFTGTTGSTFTAVPLDELAVVG